MLERRTILRQRRVERILGVERVEASNLHLIDLTKTPATDAAITNDGKSCHPVW